MGRQAKLKQANKKNKKDGSGGESSKAARKARKETASFSRFAMAMGVPFDRSPTIKELVDIACDVENVDVFTALTCGDPEHTLESMRWLTPGACVKGMSNQHYGEQECRENVDIYLEHLSKATDGLVTGTAQMGWKIWVVDYKGKPIAIKAVVHYVARFEMQGVVHFEDPSPETDEKVLFLPCDTIYSEAQLNVLNALEPREARLGNILLELKGGFRAFDYLSFLQNCDPRTFYECSGVKTKDDTKLFCVHGGRVFVVERESGKKVPMMANRKLLAAFEKWRAEAALNALLSSRAMRRKMSAALSTWRDRASVALEEERR